MATFAKWFSGHASAGQRILSVISFLAVWAILSSACVGKNRRADQDCLNCLIVEGPRISRTAFTNWEKIELAYTVRWLDGYEPVLNDLMPQAMSFGALELDPEFAEKLDIRNERKFEEENFFDIVHHLRYMGEKKGELIIPGPRFSYKRVQSEDAQVQYFPTPEFVLAYGTVLTSDADDIKEEFDLGSYQRTAMLWWGFAGIIILGGIIGSFALVFFRPVPAPLAENVAGASIPPAADKRTDLSKVFSELGANIAKNNLGAVCNGLADVIRVYAPGINPGMTSKDMTAAILSIPYEWERNQLLRVQQALLDIENHLFVGGDDTNGKVKYHMFHLTATIRGLRPWLVYWHRLLFRLTRKVRRPFAFVIFSVSLVWRGLLALFSGVKKLYNKAKSWGRP